MRAVIIVLALASLPLAARAQPADRPATPAPAASAAFEQREAWCQLYANWFIASTPPKDERTAPADVSDSHRFAVEFSSCKLDPRQYERQTLAEVQAATRAG